MKKVDGKIAAFDTASLRGGNGINIDWIRRRRPTVTLPVPVPGRITNIGTRGGLLCIPPKPSCSMAAPDLCWPVQVVDELAVGVDATTT